MVIKYLVILAIISTPSVLCSPVENEIISSKSIEILPDEENRSTANQIDFEKMKPFSDACLSFANKLYSTLAMNSSENENLFYSPVSLCTALSMLYVGTSGNSKDEMSEVLAFNDFLQGDEELLEMLGHSSELLQTKNSEGVTFKGANKVVLNEGFVPEPEYLKLMDDVFKSEIESVSFSDTKLKGAVERINQWVANSTENKIQDMVTEDMFTADFRMLLLNAVYFKGNWKIKFLTEHTKENNFYLSSTETKTTSFMNLKKQRLPYYEDDLNQYLDLEYSNPNYSMTLMLAKDRNSSFNPDAGANKVNPQLLQEIFQSLDQTIGQEVNLVIPKFKFSSEISLKEPLQLLGMVDIFSDSDAMLDKISANEELVVDRVLHKAFIDVNEKGSEAAAATAIVIGFRSAIIPRPPVEFKADRPFTFIIRHKPSGMPLFVGKVANPIYD